MTIQEALLSMSSYPMSPDAIRVRCMERGLHPDDDYTCGMVAKREYQLLKADVLTYLSEVPNVTQEGISYDILYSTRQQMAKEAEAIYRKYGDAKASKRPRYGYRGSLLRRKG